MPRELINKETLIDLELRQAVGKGTQVANQLGVRNYKSTNRCGRRNWSIEQSRFSWNPVSLVNALRKLKNQ
jgi:hypothetical protein